MPQTCSDGDTVPCPAAALRNVSGIPTKAQLLRCRNHVPMAAYLVASATFRCDPRSGTQMRPGMGFKPVQAGPAGIGLVSLGCGDCGEAAGVKFSSTRRQSGHGWHWLDREEGIACRGRLAPPSSRLSTSFVGWKRRLRLVSSERQQTVQKPFLHLGEKRKNRRALARRFAMGDDGSAVSRNARR